ncbi:MAG: hypothetical protein ABIP93_20925 [Gemmatimonadaceae bacterium]
MTDPSRFTETEIHELADAFDIVGELSVGQGTRFLIATRKSIAGAGTRREGSERVLIEVVRPPEGDESFALEQLASDTKLLSHLRHRRLISVIEGRWIGDHAYAVVREYFDDPSVADLVARGERFTNTRTAAILREVHGLLQWARQQNIVHRRITTDRLLLEPTSDRVRVSFAAGPIARVRTSDATSEDVVTVVRLAMAMLTVGIQPEESEGRSFAELRPDLPDRLHEETARLLVEPATDAELTLYLALIGMADPVAEGETERDRIRAEVLEEQRVEREKLAIARADVARLEADERRRLAVEGEELRAAFGEEKAKLEREFAAAQRLLAAERLEMQRIIANERAELLAKRNALAEEVADRFAAIENAAESDRARLDALREEIEEAGEVELERRRAAALEDIDDSEIRLDTGRFLTPRFHPPKLTPLPGIAFHRKDHLSKPEPVSGPSAAAEPWSVVEVVRKLQAPRRRPVAWRRYAVRGGIAAALLITAGSAVLLESRSSGVADLRGASAPTPIVARPAGTSPSTPAAPTAGTGAPTYANESGIVGTTPMADTLAARAMRDSVRGDSLRRASSLRLNAAVTPRDSLARRDSATRRPATQRVVKRTPATPRDPMDLMDLNESFKGDTNSEGDPIPQQ